ncbi:MAG: hypothetical protein SGPRY_003418, partial [Prymnesium sp.]
MGDDLPPGPAALCPLLLVKRTSRSYSRRASFHLDGLARPRHLRHDSRGEISPEAARGDGHLSGRLKAGRRIFLFTPSSLGRKSTNWRGSFIQVKRLARRRSKQLQQPASPTAEIPPPWHGLARANIQLADSVTCLAISPDDRFIA